MKFRGRTLAGIAIVLLCAGLFGAQAWHSFVWYGARAKEGEARRTLKRLCLAQARRQTPTSRYRELGEEVGRGNRYAYFVSAGPQLEERLTNDGPSPPDLLATGVQVDLPYFGTQSIEYAVSAADVPAHLAGGLALGGNGECPNCAWALVALGNIDLDHDLDAWSASTLQRQTEKGVDVPPCEPFHEREDLPRGPLDSLFH